jgi:heparosan-N-sulfate-glucuronate 5-epimerase
MADSQGTGFLSSPRAFSPELGSMVAPGGVRGYHIDFSFKAEAPEWPPPWLPERDRQLHVATAQWALGAYERHLKGEGERWLEAARAAAGHLIEIQEPDGSKLAGGWVHRMAMPNTFSLDPPWLSSITQGEGASLMTRLYLETGEEVYAESARSALRCFEYRPAEGGVLAELGGGPFYEEYPTSPPSYVLNGGIFALWGAYDAGLGLGMAEATRMWESGLDTLAANIGRWDTGWWSLYCLHTRPMRNVASSAYHLLHIRQLRATIRLADRKELRDAAERFEGYEEERLSRTRAFASKALFRLIVPRNTLLSARFPRTS